MKPQSYQSASGMLPLASLARKKESTPYQKAFLPTVNSCLILSSTNNDDFTTFQTKLRPEIQNVFRIYHRDVKEINRFLPKLRYTLAVLDPPYGYGKEPWDQEGWKGEQLHQIIQCLVLADAREPRSKDFYMTLVVFCSEFQLSYFLEEARNLGYPADHMVWTKPSSNLTCKYLIFNF